MWTLFGSILAGGCLILCIRICSGIAEDSKRFSRDDELQPPVIGMSRMQRRGWGIALAFCAVGIAAIAVIAGIWSAEVRWEADMATMIGQTGQADESNDNDAEFPLESSLTDVLAPN